MADQFDNSQPIHKIYKRTRRLSLHATHAPKKQFNLRFVWLARASIKQKELCQMHGIFTKINSINLRCTYWCEMGRICVDEFRWFEFETKFAFFNFDGWRKNFGRWPCRALCVWSKWNLLAVRYSTCCLARTSKLSNSSREMATVSCDREMVVRNENVSVCACVWVRCFGFVVRRQMAMCAAASECCVLVCVCPKKEEEREWIFSSRAIGCTSLH